VNKRFRTVVMLTSVLLVAACGGPGPSTAPSATASGVPSASASGAPSATASNGSTPAPSASGSAVSGEISVSGSSTVLPVSQAVAEAFHTANPDFGYTVEGPGTGDGFAALCGGSIDVADASRAIDEEEIQACADGGVTYTELLIGYDGITVMTHPDTPIECLTTADLYALFGPESDNIATWQDAATLAVELGSTTTYPADLALQISAPGEESGTYDAFLDLGGIADLGVEREIFGEDDDPYLRVPGPNYTASGDDNVIVQGVEAGSGSLGFVGFAYFQEAGDAVKAIAIDAGGGCITPSLETIGDGSYPLSRPLFIYPSNVKADENPAVQAWVDYFLSDEGIANVTDQGYVALPADQLHSTRDAWSNR
jgi:phosphate transport system substrate-binding protein